MSTNKQSVISRLLAALGRCYTNRFGSRNLRGRTLRVENLENRELLSATNLLGEIASSAASTPFETESKFACYSSETINDDVIDLSSLLKTTGDVSDSSDGEFITTVNDNVSDSSDDEFVTTVYDEYAESTDDEFITTVNEDDSDSGDDEFVTAVDEYAEDTDDVAVDATDDEQTAIASPAAPSDISFGTYDLETHKVQMYWVDNADNEDGFRVEFSTDGGLNWYASQKGVIGADVTERTATGVYTNHTYDFRICAYNAGGDSDYAYATYTPLTEVTTSDAAPVVGSQIFANVAPEGATADYAWYVSEDGTNWSEEPVATTSDYTPTAMDSDCFLKVVATGTEYNFGQVSTIVGPVLSNGPAAPSDVVLGAYDLENGSLEMSWTLNSDNEEQVIVQFTIDGGKTWRDGAILEAGTESRDARIVRVGQTYQFRVRAINAEGASAWAYSETFAPQAEVTSVTVAYSQLEVGEKLTTGLTSNAGFSVGSVKATYEWYRSLDGENWTEIGWNGSSHTISNDDAGYYLKVVATGKSPYYYGSAEYVTEVVPGVPCAPDAPSDVTLGAYNLETGELEMNWTLNSTNETSVYVQYTVDGGETWKDAAILDAGTESRLARIVRVGQTYQFRVAAHNVNGYSDWAYSESFAPQANVTSVVVSGELTVGSELTTKVESNAAFSVGSVKADYAWYRSVDGENWTQIDWGGAGYTITGDDAGCRLKVVVTGKGDYYVGSAEYVTDFVKGELQPPAAPSDVTLGAYNLETGKLEMSWTLNSTNETSINVEYTIDGGATWRTGAILKGGSVDRLARVVRVGQTYQFRVNAINAAGASEWAYSEKFVPQAEVVGVSVEGNLSIGSKLTAKPSSNAVFSVGSVKVDYAWYRSADGENWSEVLWTGSSYKLKSADANCYIKVVVTGKGDYYYGSAEYITEKVEAEKVAPATPGDFTFGEYDPTTGELEMSWKLNSNNEDSVSVRYSIDGGETWKVAAELGAGTESRIGETVRVGNVYYYAVFATNSFGSSEWLYSDSYVPQGEIDDVQIGWEGSLTVGTVIKAEAGTNAQYIVGDIDVDYEWFRSADGETWTTTDVVGDTYEVQTADRGCYLKVVATGRPESYYGSIDASTETRVLSSVVGITVEGEAKYGATLKTNVAPADASVTYEWYRSADGETWEAIGATEANYTIQKADSNCFLKVVATGVEEAGFTGAVEAVTERVVGVPAAPSDVVLGMYNLSTGELEMSWTLNSTDEIAIGVEYSTDGGETWITSEKATTTLAAGTTSRLAKNVRVGLQYRFRVCAKGEIGDSDWAYSEVYAPTASLTSVKAEYETLDVGSVVKASLTSDATFRFGDITADYAWYRSADGETWEAIDATGSSYTATVDDLGCMLKVVAKGVGVYGGVVEAQTEVVSSDATIDDVFKDFNENDWIF